MWPTSATWAQLIRGGKQVIPHADALYDGDVTVPDLPIVTATWRASYDTAVRAQLDIEVANREQILSARTAMDPLASYGQQIAASIELSVPSANVTEAIPMGVFRIERSDPEGSMWTKWSRRGVDRWVPQGGVIRASCLDVTQDLKDAEFPGPTQPLTGASVASEIQRICAGIVGVDIDNIPARGVPKTVVYQDSCWDAVVDLAAVVGMVIVADRDGTVSFRTPQPGTPVWSATTTDRTLVEAQLAHDRAGLFNCVVATGEDQGDGTTPVRGVAYLRSGPYRWDGPLGRLIYRHSSPLYRTNPQAQTGAQTILNRLVAGWSVQIPFTTTFNPALDVLDTIRVELDPVQGWRVDAMITDLSADLVAGDVITGVAVADRAQVIG